MFIGQSEKYINFARKKGSKDKRKRRVKLAQAAILGTSLALAGRSLYKNRKGLNYKKNVLKDYKEDLSSLSSWSKNRLKENPSAKTAWKDNSKKWAKSRANYKIRKTLIDPMETILTGSTLASGVPLAVGIYEKRRKK